MSGVIHSPVWREDPALGRGYLVFSEPSADRLWRWEEGGGAFTIGRSLFMLHSGCEAGKQCETEGVSRGVHAMASIPSQSTDIIHPMLICEGGNQRISSLTSEGHRRMVITVDAIAGKERVQFKNAAFAPNGDALIVMSSVASGLSRIWRLKSSLIERDGTDINQPRSDEVSPLDLQSEHQERAVAFAPNGQVRYSSRLRETSLTVVFLSRCFILLTTKVFGHTWCLKRGRLTLPRVPSLLNQLPPIQ